MCWLLYRASGDPAHLERAKARLEALLSQLGVGCGPELAGLEVLRPTHALLALEGVL